MYRVATELNSRAYTMQSAPFLEFNETTALSLLSRYFTCRVRANHTEHQSRSHRPNSRLDTELLADGVAIF